MKSHLDDRSLPTNGLKDVLVQRLIKDLLFQRLKEAEKCTTAVAHEIQAPLLIGGVVGKSASLLNGVYEPTRDVHNGKPLFKKQGDRDMWLRFNSSNTWVISSEIDEALPHYSSFSHGVESDIDHPTNVKTWMIFARGKSRVHAAMKCVWLSPPVLITGVVGRSAKILNGVYEATHDVHNGKPLFRKQGDPNRWLRFDDDNVWAICSSASKDANIKGSACWCHSVQAELDHPTKVTSWRTFEKTPHNWEVHASMKCCYTCVWWSSSALIEASQAVTKVQIAYCVGKNSSTFLTYKYILCPTSPLGALHVFKQYLV